MNQCKLGFERSSLGVDGILDSLEFVSGRTGEGVNCILDESKCGGIACKTGIDACIYNCKLVCKHQGLVGDGFLDLGKFLCKGTVKMLN